MSAGKEDTPQHELVIIRRRGGGAEGGHKGGVWKIAYADFMTAMMAFFLVMWLINATDKTTITQIATYFNPIRLNERAPSTRGMHDSDAVVGRRRSQDPPAAETETEQPEENRPGPAPGPSDKQRPRQSDPARVRAKADAPKRSGPGDDAASAVAADAFDPFDPAFMRIPKAAPPAPGGGSTGRQGSGAGSTEAEAEPREPARHSPATAEGRGKTDGGEQAALAAAAVPPAAPAAEALRSEPSPPAGEASQKAAKSGAAPTASGEEPAPPAAEARESARTGELAALGAAIKEAAGPPAAGGAPDIEVRATAEGMLISLTDKYDFGMFALSSAMPRPELVALMERIAKVVADRPGPIIVRGHTDGRVYRSGNYDNWRLSSARAYVAYSLLVRGGVDEKRFTRIEGHADRSPKIAEDPNAAQNRRIEILLRWTDS